MRARPFISLIAVGAATAGLLIACGDSDPTGGLPPRPPMFTTIDGVVRYMDTVPVYTWPDSVWLDSIPVPGVVVRAQAFLAGESDTRTELHRTTTGPSGEYHLEFTASCAFGEWYIVKVDSHEIPFVVPSGARRQPQGVCSVPNIQHDIWVVPD